MGVARKLKLPHQRPNLINVTTTDAFNRTTVDTYTYLIDGEVTSTPTLAPDGTHININSATHFGSDGRIVLANIVDAGGVGPDYAQCYWNNNPNPVTYTTSSSLTPPSNVGQTTNFTLNCRIVDQVGNIGSNTTYQGVVDLVGPNTTYTPLAGTTITQNTTLTITSSDDNLNGTSTATITWTSTDGSATWNTTVNYNGTWTGTMAGLNASLGDGTVTISTIARDWFGNQQASNLNNWTLNTTTATSIFALNYSTGMVKVGNYLSPTVRFTVTPPTGGSFTTTTQHSTLGQIGSHPTPETTQESWGWPGSSSSLTSGQIWINVTTTDAFNRTTVDTYTYLIDGDFLYINTNTVHHRLEHNPGQPDAPWTKLTTTTGQPSRCRRRRIQ